MAILPSAAAVLLTIFVSSCLAVLTVGSNATLASATVAADNGQSASTSWTPPAEDQNSTELSYRGLMDLKTNIDSSIGFMMTQIGGATKGMKNKLICKGCTSLVTVIRWTRKRHIPVSLLTGLMRSACVRFTDKTARVCNGMVDMIGEEVITLLTNNEHAAVDICHVFFNICPAKSASTKLNWSVSLPPKVPSSALASRDASTNSSSVTTAVAQKPLRMLHLTDIHIDPLYVVGSAGECDEPICCREPALKPDTPKAGYWGYTGLCDTPHHFLDAMLAHIARNEKVDFIIWTGDSVPHDIWNQSRPYQLNLTSAVNAAIKHHFPNTPVYATLGNHDSYPLNAFPPPSTGEKYSLSWLYDIVANEWIGWGPDEQQRRNIVHGGYYAHRLRPGLKIISLNTNYCAKLNWWLLLSFVDPAGEMAWLVQELSESERLNEAVFIISHISPTGDKCIETWRENYFRIVARFKDTIRGTFFGHSHFDEFGVTYDPDNLSRPTSIAYISPSTTTYRHVNPGYRVFLVENDNATKTHNILDFETYIVNMTEANARAARRPNGVGHVQDDLEWKLEYTAREQYGLADLTPKSWSNFSSRMRSDDSLFKTYYNNRYKQQETWTEKRCENECRDVLLCSTQANACAPHEGPTPMYRGLDIVPGENLV